MTTVSSLLAAVAVLSLADAAPAASRPAAAGAAYYYEPIVPYGPYPAHGYVVSTYVPPQYPAGYRVVMPVSYGPNKHEYDKDPHQKYDEEEPKYYYGGKFNGN